MKHFIPFFLYSLFRPVYFIHLLSETNSPFWGTIFFLINFTFALGGLLIRTYLQNSNPSILFQSFSEIIFFYPLALVGFLFFSFILYILSVLLGGKTSFGQSLSAMGLSSFPLIVFFLPYLALLGIFVWATYLVFSFYKIYHYKFHLAVIGVVVPFLVVAAFMIAVGLLNLAPVMSTISSWLQ